MPRLRYAAAEAADKPTVALTKTAAIYCRISLDREEQRAGVGRQEVDCRKIAAEQGYEVPDEFVFIDNNKSAWKRNRNRPGWDALIEGMQTSRFDAVICWNPDRLMRQPADLEKLLLTAEDSTARGRPVALVGTANQRDLNDPTERFMLRIEVAQAAKSSDDTSRRAKRALLDRAAAGKTHGGMRPFGYEPGGMVIRESEAELIKELVRRTLQGTPIRTLVNDFNERGIPTSMNKRWYPNTIRSILTGCRIAGLRQHNGVIVGKAQWPGIIDEETWNLVQDALERRNIEWQDSLSGVVRNYYLLRGMVRCGKCGSLMSGEKAALGRSYRCRKGQTAAACGERRIMATQLEEFIATTAVAKLAALDLKAELQRDVDPSAMEALAEDHRQLSALREEWSQKLISQEEYDRLKVRIVDRIKRTEQGQHNRPLTTLDGMTGPEVVDQWATLTNERKNAILRVICPTIRIHPSDPDGPRSFDIRRAEPDWTI